MAYLPHTDEERRQMLEAIGVDALERLFDDLPAQHRYPELGLPEPLSEMEVLQELKALAATNLATDTLPTFLGAGAYRHWVPAVVDTIISRSEFATAYTPYQAEISQGTLQAIFEYQSLICDLTGMEVANASHYDGATAAAEAVIQAYNVFRKKRNKVILSPMLNPFYRQVIHTYTQGMGLQIVGEDLPPSDLAGLIAQVDAQTACVILQSPDFWGRLLPLRELIEQIRQQDAETLVAVAAHPISLALFRTPGEDGADIVFGDGQPLGLGLNFGGPYLGYYATRERYVRQTAGRLVGLTNDTDGRRAFTMTLTTREQHIRRDKATSNICSNQGLMSLAATVYLSALGKHGLRRIAELAYHKAHYAAAQIDALAAYSVMPTGAFFNEFVVQCPGSVDTLNRALLEGKLGRRMIGGYDLGREDPALAGRMLVAVTELNSRDEIDGFVSALERFAAAL